jgi:predicted butyrate kinase (DUF1464 family)
LSKSDLFCGGAADQFEERDGETLFRESLIKAVASLQATTPFHQVLLSGRLMETQPLLVEQITADLRRLATVSPLASLPGAWVKHAAQGAALLADGLAGGKAAGLIGKLALREAGGTVLDWLRHPRAAEIRAAFGVQPLET